MNDRRMLKRLRMIPPEQTVQDLVDWCMQEAHDPANMRVTGGHLQWESPEDDEEFERGQDYKRRTDERHEAYERATWLRLAEKYGGSVPISNEPGSFPKLVEGEDY